MKFWRDYKVEFIIFLIGTLISVLSLNINSDIALVVFIVTLSMNIVVISVKYYLKDLIEQQSSNIEKDIKSFFECSFEYLLHGNNVDDRWKDKVSQSFNEFKERIKGLYDGELLLKYEELFFYQNDLINKTKKKLYAIHVADTVESLKLCEPERIEKSRFKNATYYACKDLNKNVEKRRLFLLDKQLEEQEKELVKNVVRDQKETLGFSVKKIYIEDIGQKQNTPYDTIISDDEEVIEIVMRFNKVERAHAYINEEKVRRTISEFEKLWKTANEFEEERDEKSTDDVN